MLATQSMPKHRGVVGVHQMELPTFRAHQVLQNGSAGGPLDLRGTDQGDRLWIEHSAHVQSTSNQVLSLFRHENIVGRLHPEPQHVRGSPSWAQSGDGEKRTAHSRGGLIGSGGTDLEPDPGLVRPGRYPPAQSAPAHAYRRAHGGLRAARAGCRDLATGRHRGRAAARTFEHLHRDRAARRRLGL